MVEPDAVEGGAFEAFVREVEPVLRSVLVARHGRERGVVATGEALSWAWEHWDRVARIARPVPYLSRVGTSRTRWRRKPLVLLDEVHSSDGGDFEPGLDDALAALSTRQRSCVVLVTGLGYSFSEAADLLSIRKATVQRHHERGLEKLRSLMGVDGADDHG